MRFATWCIVSCLLIFLEVSDVDPISLCPRIEDIEGNCKVDGPKGCGKYMSTIYNRNYFNCTCDNVYMLHKIKRYCRCESICPNPPPPPIQPR
ncbi:hypothetical protein N665_0550s0013 [Sinapis alba]|nr:hypothetical protein N665_0550s0013 [Sinapis alba]